MLFELTTWYLTVMKETFLYHFLKKLIFFIGWRLSLKCCLLHRNHFYMHFLCISSWMAAVNTQQYFAGVGFLVMPIFIVFPLKWSGWFKVRGFILYVKYGLLNKNHAKYVLFWEGWQFSCAEVGGGSPHYVKCDTLTCFVVIKWLLKSSTLSCSSFGCQNVCVTPAHENQ